MSARRPSRISVRHHRGDGESPMSAIHREVAIERQHGTLGMLLGHADEASIGQRHRHAGVASHEARGLGHGAALEELRHGTGSTARATGACLRDDRLARRQRRRLFGELRRGPAVVAIAPIEEGHEPAGVEQRAQGQRPYPRRWRGSDERSTGSDTQPARSRATAANDLTRGPCSRASAASSAARTMLDLLTRCRAAVAASREPSDAGSFTESVVVRLAIPIVVIVIPGP